MAFSLAEIAFLSAHSLEINEVARPLKLQPATRLKDANILRKAFGEYGRAALELATARRSGKLPHPDIWLADHDAVQQATPLIVAKYRAEVLAKHFPDALVHDVTCSIGTEGWACQESGLQYIGSDIDPARALLAAKNLPNALITRSDALYPSIRLDAVDIVLADPARRAGGRRIARPEDLLPPLAALFEVYASAKLVVKCAPGLDFKDFPGTVELISVDGGVKEACLYSSGVQTGGKRQATVFRGGKLVDHLDDEIDTSAVSAGDIGDFIIDPDGAVVRAGLVRHFAAREGLWMLDERIAYLTGSRIPAMSTGFPVLEVVSLKQLKKALWARGAGSLEVLVRGVDIDPDILRKKLKLRGSQALAVVLTRIGRTGVAVICGPRTAGVSG